MLVVFIVVPSSLAIPLLDRDLLALHLLPAISRLGDVDGDGDGSRPPPPRRQRRILATSSSPTSSSSLRRLRLPKACDLAQRIGMSDADIHSANPLAVSVFPKLALPLLRSTYDADIHSANPLASRYHSIPVIPFLGSPTSVFASASKDLLFSVDADGSDAAAASWLLPELAKDPMVKSADCFFSDSETREEMEDCRMASRQRGEKRSKNKEDSLTRANPEKRFVSEIAKVNFDSIRDTRKPILERGFEFERMECPDVYDNMCKRKWELFCKSPSLANLSLVNEFYANAIERKDYKVYVRGKTVSFDPKTINEHYGIQISRLENCYDIFEKNPDLETISAMLCDGEIEWGRSKGPKRGFMSKCLSLQMTLWFLFISTRIMPGTHISEVTRERAILLHAILVEYKLDVGRMISKAIISCIDNSRIGLYFPSLISDLCIKALVPTSDDDEWKKPMNPIGSVAIKRIYTNKYEMGERIPSASTANQPHVPVNVSLSSRLARLEKNQKNWVNYQADYNEYQSGHMASMDGLLRGIASHLNMDVTQFPSTSNCPPSFRIEDEGESEEDEEDGEGEERGDSDEDEDEGDRDDNIDED